MNTQRQSNNNYNIRVMWFQNPGKFIPKLLFQNVHKLYFSIGFINV